MLAMTPFFSFLNVVLNGLKQVTFKGCSACEVWEDKVIIFKPKACVCSINSKITWDPWLFIISKWWLVIEIPHGTCCLKKERNFLKKEHVIHGFKNIVIMYMFCKTWYSYLTISHLWKCKTLVKLHLLHSLHNS